MPYAHRRMHDADAHVMETAQMLRECAEPAVRARLPQSLVAALSPGEDERLIAAFRARHVDPAYRAEDEAQILLRKNWAATGSFLKQDRSQALDLLGFESQLVFNTFVNQTLLKAERGDDVDFAYGFARAHNRAMLDFCAADRRLLATCYVPLRDFAQSRAIAGEAIAAGASALLVPSGCPRGHAPSHPGLFPVWEQAVEAGLPVVFHVGGGIRAADDRLLDRDYFENGGPPVPDFHGGDENFRSVDYMAIPDRADADDRHADLRRRARPVPDAQARRDRAGRLVGAELDALHGLRVRGVPQERGAAAEARAAAERIRATLRSAPRPTPPRTSAGSSPTPATRCACSPPTTRTSKAAATRSGASRRA